MLRTRWHTVKQMFITFLSKLWSTHLYRKCPGCISLYHINFIELLIQSYVITKFHDLLEQPSYFRHKVYKIYTAQYACDLCWFFCQMSQICSKMVTYLFSAYFVRYFCCHSNGKSQITSRLLHLGYCSNKYKKKLVKSIFYLFLFVLPHTQGGLKSRSFMRVALC